MSSRLSYGVAVPELDQLRAGFFFWLAASVVVGLVTFGLWHGLPGFRRRVAPRPTEPFRGSILVVYLGVIAFLFLGPLLEQTFGMILGTEQVRERAASNMVRQLWIMLASGPLLLAVVLGVAWLDGRTPPRGVLGMTRGRGLADLTLGLFAGFAVTPSLNLLNAALSWGMAIAFEILPEEHPITRLARQGLSPLEWTVLLGATVLAAPLKEEVLFRGVLQRWLAERSWGGDLAMGAALVVSVLFRLDGIRNAWSGGGGSSLLVELATTVFVLVMTLPYLFLRTRPDVAALYGTSLLFGAIHASVWPTPIPLFLFGLILGELTRRTGSVVPSLAAHAFFNAAACAVLVGTR